eukprot:PhF_6_TR27145/c0_g2_i3/m.39645
MSLGIPEYKVPKTVLDKVALHEHQTHKYKPQRRNSAARIHNLFIETCSIPLTQSLEKQIVYMTTKTFHAQLWKALEVDDVDPFVQVLHLDPTMTTIRDILDPQGRTIAHIACRDNCHHILRIILKALSDNDLFCKWVTTHSKMSLLHYAIAGGHLELCQMLRDHYLRFETANNSTSKNNVLQQQQQQQPLPPHLRSVVNTSARMRNKLRARQQGANNNNPTTSNPHHHPPPNAKIFSWYEELFRETATGRSPLVLAQEYQWYNIEHWLTNEMKVYQKLRDEWLLRELDIRVKSRQERDLVVFENDFYFSYLEILEEESRVRIPFREKREKLDVWFRLW